MSDFQELSVPELKELSIKLQDKYDEFKSKKLSLNMSRGKPSPEQLDLSMGMLDKVNSNDKLILKDGVDARNYGVIDGIEEAKELFSQVLQVSKSEILVGGNSSLTIMHDTVARAMLHGVNGSEVPWGKLPKVKFLCPSPGYDRHFAVTELFNIEMINIDMLSDGPDMDQVEKLVAEDEAIKGIWCVPKYSNPDGVTYSDEVVERLAAMKTKASDFRIFWDDAYTLHHHDMDHPDQLKNILEVCKATGNPDRVFIFSSTSKITFPGSGVAVMAASEDNMTFIKKLLAFQTIGPDKINQLRHVRFFKDVENLKDHMAKHAAIVKPKFDVVIDVLEAELSGKNIAWWHQPNGGYFMSLNTLDGCAQDVVNMAAEVGVTLTNAGATYPYGKDPRNRNIRLAPTFPTQAELKTALEIVCLCVQIVSIKKLLAQ